MSTRADFEAWAASRGHDLRKTINGTYRYSAALNAYAGWQAATSHQEAKIKALTASLETLRYGILNTCNEAEMLALIEKAIAAAKETP